jgi:hypothetical protein
LALDFASLNVAERYKVTPHHFTETLPSVTLYLSTEVAASPLPLLQSVR